MRVRMWEKGHTFDEIDEMNLDDFGDVLGYWNEEGRIAQKNARSKKRKAGRK